MAEDYKQEHNSDDAEKKSIDGDGDSVADVSRKGFFHINRNTLPLKITLFLFDGAMAAILPYLTIHMRDLGISLTRIGIIYAVLPFTAFLGPPIMGFMADKFGQYKTVLIVATIINSVAHSCLLAVPQYSESWEYSYAVIEFGSGGGRIGGEAELRPQSIKHCDGFSKSLHFSGGKPFQNQMINVHTCNKTMDGFLTRRGLDDSDLLPISSIPQRCQWETRKVNKTEIIHCYTCGNISPASNFCDDVNGNQLVETFGRLINGRIPDRLKKCSLKVRINSGDFQQPGRRKNFQRVTCQTNYTFPTGKKLTSGNEELTFWLYFALRIIGNLFMATCFSLLDATTLAIVAKNKGAEFGKERIVCVLAFALVSPLAGLLVDVISSSKGYTDYSSSFYLSNILIGFNVLGYVFLKLDIEKPNDDIWKDAAALLHYPEVVVFLGMIFVLGNMWGFVESYLPIFLDELKAPKYLLGLTLTVSSLSSIPILFGAEKIISKLGRVNIIVTSFLIYCFRFVGYSYIPNPFWCFPFEVLEAFTYQLMWVAAATYCAVLAPTGLLGTLTGVMGSLHYGLGKGSGAFIGGYLINMCNTRHSFRYFGGASAVIGVIYFLINKCWLERTIRKRNEGEQGKPDTEQKKSMLSASPQHNIPMFEFKGKS